MGVFAQDLSDDSVFKGRSGIFLALLDLDPEHRQNANQLVRQSGKSAYSLNHSTLTFMSRWKLTEKSLVILVKVSDVIDAM